MCGGAQCTHRIATDGVLDLVDLGPELAQDRGRIGSGHEVADIDDTDAIERSVFRLRGTLVPCLARWIFSLCVLYARVGFALARFVRFLDHPQNLSLGYYALPLAACCKSGRGANVFGCP